jgi:hypothetical protein
LVPNLFNLSNFSGTIKVKGSKSKLAQETKNQMFNLIEEMKPENTRINELLAFARKGFFVNFKMEGKKLDSPFSVERSLVKERIKEINEMIANGEPFFLLSFSEIQKRIAQGLLQAAFESIIPIRPEINQLIIPIKTC